jgi:transketolase
MTRVLPGLTVVVPCDGEEARKATLAIAKHVGPYYLRLEQNQGQSSY